MDMLPKKLRRQMLGWSMTDNSGDQDAKISDLEKICMDITDYVSSELKKINESIPNQPAATDEDTELDQLEDCLKQIVFFIDASTQNMESKKRIKGVMAALWSSIFDVMFVQSKTSQLDEKDWENSVGYCFKLLKDSATYPMAMFVQFEFMEDSNGGELIKLLIGKIRDILKADKMELLGTKEFFIGVLLYHKAGQVVGYGRKVEKSLKKILLKRNKNMQATLQWIRDTCPQIWTSYGTVLEVEGLDVLLDGTQLTKDDCELLLKAITGNSDASNNDVPASSPSDSSNHIESLHSGPPSHESVDRQISAPESELNDEIMETTPAINTFRSVDMVAAQQDVCSGNMDMDFLTSPPRINTAETSQQNDAVSSNEWEIMPVIKKTGSTSKSTPEKTPISPSKRLASPAKSSASNTDDGEELMKTEGPAKEREEMLNPEPLSMISELARIGETSSPVKTRNARRRLTMSSSGQGETTGTNPKPAAPSGRGRNRMSSIQATGAIPQPMGRGGHSERGKSISETRAQDSPINDSSQDQQPNVRGTGSASSKRKKKVQESKSSGTNISTPQKGSSSNSATRRNIGKIPNRVQSSPMKESSEDQNSDIHGAASVSGTKRKETPKSAGTSGSTPKKGTTPRSHQYTGCSDREIITVGMTNPDLATPGYNTRRARMDYSAFFKK